MYHFSVKCLSRSRGRRATAAAAYRAAQKIVDRRTGVTFDFSRKSGVVHAEILVPPGAPSWAKDRELLWNAVEKKETRVNSTVAREFEVAIPAELDEYQRRAFAVDFAREIVARHRCAVDLCLHEPSRRGHRKNYHAHILCTTRRLEREGFTEKTRELDVVKSGEVAWWRQRFAEIQNEHLRRAGHTKRVDHRTLRAQGILRAPTVHLGSAATNFERRTNLPSRRRQELDQKIEWENSRLESISKKPVPLELDDEIGFRKRDLDKFQEAYERNRIEPPLEIESRERQTSSLEQAPEVLRLAQDSPDSSLEDEFDDDARADVPRF